MFVSLLVGTAAASPACGVLLSGYLEPHDAEVVPCLVDLQEAGLCFRLPGMTLESATRTLDAHLQEQGVSRPAWEGGRGTNGSVVITPGGDRLEIVIATASAFATTGSCRVVADRRSA